MTLGPITPSCDTVRGVDGVTQVVALGTHPQAIANPTPRPSR
jgi:hypothetical protein